MTPRTTPDLSAELTAALGAREPFRSLDPPALATTVAATAVYDYAPDVAILVEDGPPADWLWFVLDGTVALLHDGQTIDVLRSGDCFGHPSLLSGMAPAYTVRSRGTVRCAVLPRDTALRVLGTPAGSVFVAATMRRRLVRQTHTVRGLPDVGTTPVSALMRPARFIEPSCTVREGLAGLGEPGVSGLVVGGGQAVLALLTDREVRVALGAGGLSLEDPVGAIARAPAPTVALGRLAVEAAIDMLAAAAECVVVVEGDRAVGVLSAADLVGLDARSPVALRHTLLGAADEDGLVRSASHIPGLFCLLVDAGVPARDLGRVLSLQHDAIVSRLTDLSLSRHGPVAERVGVEIPWAWLDLGSAARREFTLSSDQDNALAYGDPPAELAAEVDAYFERVGLEVGAGLTRCGIGADDNGVLAGRRPWRMSKAHWLATFDDCLTVPDDSHLLRATVAFDFRTVAGGLALTAELTERMRAANRHPGFMRRMATLGSGFPVALNRRGHLQTGSLDAPPGTLDLKRGAIVPLTNLVRYHALAAAVTISPTLDRIAGAASVGELDRDTADALTEAFTLITTTRLRHHAAQIVAGLPPDNFVDPGALPPVARADLTIALKSIRRAQRRLAVVAAGR